MYSTEVPLLSVPGYDVHQKSVIHCSVVGVSSSYLTPTVKVSIAAVVPPVADYLIAISQSCHIAGQKDSCANNDIIPTFSSSTINPDLRCDNCDSCELCGWYPTIHPHPSSLPFSLADPLTWLKTCYYKAQSNNQHLHCYNTQLPHLVCWTSPVLQLLESKLVQ